MCPLRAQNREEAIISKAFISSLTGSCNVYIFLFLVIIIMADDQYMFQQKNMFHLEKMICME